ncbi:MAG TPA: sigma-70 family RNA polymerase sigma factor [Gemmatimonadaceae bacterium]|jgi:RNA polymerase sigma-70 factor (ECF subfamily)
MPRFSDGSLAPLVTTDTADGLAFRSRLERVQANDMTALGELFAEHGDMVYRAALRLTGSRADAEDVTQELFVRLPGAVRGFTGTAANFPGWLRRVAVRQALMHLRGGRRRREVSVASVSALTMPADGALERLTIDAALARLSDEHRTVFLLKEVEGYDHAEIAELLGISTANSEVRLHRARRQLRDLLRGSR